MSGKHIVRSVPKRKFGVWKGKVKIKKGFNKLPKSIADAFAGKLP